MKTICLNHWVDLSSRQIERNGNNNKKITKNNASIGPGAENGRGSKMPPAFHGKLCPNCFSIPGVSEIPLDESGQKSSVVVVSFRCEVTKSRKAFAI